MSEKGRSREGQLTSASRPDASVALWRLADTREVRRSNSLKPQGDAFGANGALASRKLTWSAGQRSLPKAVDVEQCAAEKRMSVRMVGEV